jgi:hypothetical protein
MSQIPVLFLNQAFFGKEGGFWRLMVAVFGIIPFEFVQGGGGWCVKIPTFHILNPGK